MAEKSKYSPSVLVGGGLTPAGEFPIITATDVATDDKDGRLDHYLPIIMTQAEYNNLEEYGETEIELKDGSKEKIFYDENKIYLIKYMPPIDPNPNPKV